MKNKELLLRRLQTMEGMLKKLRMYFQVMMLVCL